MSIAGSDSHSTAETEHLHLEGHVSDINSAEKPPTPGLYYYFFFIHFILFPANFAGVFGGQNLHHRWDCSVQTSCPQNYSGGACQEVKHNPLNPVQSAAVACAHQIVALSSQCFHKVRLQCKTDPDWVWSECPKNVFLVSFRVAQLITPKSPFPPGPCRAEKVNTHPNNSEETHLPP